MQWTKYQIYSGNVPNMYQFELPFEISKFSQISDAHECNNGLTYTTIGY